MTASICLSSTTAGSLGVRVRLGFLVGVLVGIDLIIPQPAQEGVETAGQERAEDGPEPVDPRVPRERAVDGSGTQCAGGIERAAREMDA